MIPNNNASSYKPGVEKWRVEVNFVKKNGVVLVGYDLYILLRNEHKLIFEDILYCHFNSIKIGTFFIRFNFRFKINK